MSLGTKQTEWYDPTVEEVADGVYRMPLPLPTDALRAVNVYLIAGADGSAVCIDSGWAVPEGREVLDGSLKTLGFDVGDIDRFLVTHIHRDHYTQAIAIRREVPTKIALGAGERESLEMLCTPREERPSHTLNNLKRNGASELAGRMEQSWSTQPPQTFKFEMPDEWLRDGESVDVPGRMLDVIETPGHTRGHVVFHDAKEGLLFAGDHVLSTITPSIGVEVSPYANPLGQFLASLARVRQLPDALLLPAHGPVRTSVHARVDELVAHHGRRLENTVAAVQAGADTAFEVAGQLSWTRHERNMEELDLFNQSLAVSETAAHLELLEAQGRVRRSVEGGVNHYVVN
jgi:glyoxylase-like metal-dependent hydrolase (beta-lactamase superfamily II)